MNKSFNDICGICKNAEFCKYKETIEKLTSDIDGILEQSNIISAKVSCKYFNGNNSSIRIIPCNK